MVNYLIGPKILLEIISINLSLSFFAWSFNVHYLLSIKLFAPHSLYESSLVRFIMMNIWQKPLEVEMWRKSLCSLTKRMISLKVTLVAVLRKKLASYKIIYSKKKNCVTNGRRWAFIFLNKLILRVCHLWRNF